MNAVLEQPTATPYSARHMLKPVNFYFAEADARAVNLMGDFNDWNPDSLPMQRRVDGWWFIQVPLPHGHHTYLFLVDGVAMLDPKAAGTVQLDRGTKASLVAVS